MSSRDAASAAIGDICHELNERRAAGAAPAWPALWVNMQVARTILASLVASVPWAGRAFALVLRDALRSIGRSPAHSVFVASVLAVAMAAGTVTFSVVDAVVLRPLPIAEPDRVVLIPPIDPDHRDIRTTPDVFWRLHDYPSSLESVTVVSLSASNSTTPITIGAVTAVFRSATTISDTFRVFRMTPVLGRFWTAEDEAQGVTDVAVLSHRLWRDRFGGSPDVLGMTVTMYKRTLRVIGVASADTADPNIPLLAADVWLAMAAPRAVDGMNSFVAPIGRMKPGVTIPDVVADVQHALGTNAWRPDVKRLSDVYTNLVSGWMLLALGVAGLVVLIACVNAANLLLTRSVERQRETGVRAALGASRARLAGGAMLEGLILSSLASAGALVFAIWGVESARRAMTTLPLGVFRGAAIALNGRVFVAAIVASVVTGLLVAIVPAWQASRASVVTLLKDGAPTAASGRGPWRTTFLVTEVAAVSVLFVVSWLFVASLVRSMSVDLGLDQGHLIAVRPSGPLSVSIEEAKLKLERAPGVSAVAISRMASPPIFGRVSGAWITNGFTRAGEGASPVEMLDYRVSENLFEVMGMRFLRGSTWSADARNQPFTSAPVVLDDGAATRLFGALDPMGRQVATTDPAGLHTVIGIVRHVKGSGPEEEGDLAAYFPLNPDPPRGFASLLVRAAGSPDALVPVLSDLMAPMVPAGGVVSVSTANDALRIITTRRRFTALLMSLFGLVGALIGAAGIYAVMAAVVAQKTHEIGVRVALGATSRDVQRQILGVAIRHLGAGLLIGLPVAWWLSRGFTALLFQVTPATVSVYAGVAILLCSVGLAAALIPSRRAARIDPIICLRAQ